MNEEARRTPLATIGLWVLRVILAIACVAGLLLYAHIEYVDVMTGAVH